MIATQKCQANESLFNVQCSLDIFIQLIRSQMTLINLQQIGALDPSIGQPVTVSLSLQSSVAQYCCAHFPSHYVKHETKQKMQRLCQHLPNDQIIQINIFRW